MAAVSAHPGRFEKGFGVLEVTLSGKQSDAIEALGIATKHRLAWYESLMVAAAMEGGCEILYSEDLQHGREIEDLRIENPFA